jgi:fibronectin type 3 domain-containing protein
MKTLNSKIFLTVIFLSIFSSKIFSQNAGVYAAGGAKGIFINHSNEINISGAQTVFNISRTDKQGKQIEIAELRTVKTITDFTNGISKFHPVLPNSPVPNDDEIKIIWEKITKTNNIDSVALWGAYPLIKLALGLMYLDSTVTTGEEYKYVIENNNGRETTSSETNFASYPQQPAFDKIKIVIHSANSSVVSIEWQTSSENNPVNFIVYRQDNGKGNFNPAEVTKGFARNEKNTFLYAVDNSVEANNFYKYFLIPLDLFENRGASSDTLFAGAYNYNTLPAIQNLSALSVDSLQGILLSWEIPAPDAVVSVRIFKSEIFDSSFSQIAEVSPNQYNYLDLMVEPMKRYYYYVQQIGPLGEESPTSARIASFYLSSEIPIPPVNLSAEGISNGVKLSWENSESFIEGFRVYRSNGLNDSLLQVSDLIQEEKPFTTFIDSSKELSGKLTYFYSVKSFSTSHFESSFSDIVSTRPAIPTTPLKPTGLSGYVENNSALISWDDMSEKEDAVLGYLILRKDFDKEGNAINDFHTLTDSILQFNQNSFADNSIEKNKNYEYAVVSLDMFGGKSEMSNTFSINNSPERPLPPSGLKAILRKDEVKIKWEPSLQEDIIEYKVYRQKRNSEPEYLGSVKSNFKPEMTDKGITKDELYFYFVTTVNKFDVESSPSKSVPVRL